jgi:hypothetical protein
VLQGPYNCHWAGTFVRQRPSGFCGYLSASRSQYFPQHYTPRDAGVWADLGRLAIVWKSEKLMRAHQFRYCIELTATGVFDPREFSAVNYAGVGTIINDDIDHYAMHNLEWAIQRTINMNNWAQR